MLIIIFLVNTNSDISRIDPLAIHHLFILSDETYECAWLYRQQLHHAS